MNTPLYERPAVYLVLAVVLLVIGLFGFLRRRTLIGMLISGEILFMAASLNVMALNRFFSPQPASGQIFVLLIMGLAAGEVAIGLSIIIAVYRNFRSIRTQDLSEMKG
ncbi:MAG: NADH-quinone oxidoreductase subunit NuoK [Verrucomicrobiales bacterium]|nr:NADH-quinone oxidoreductase subunit NuoK [Verrucomicrobiales bacterium]